MYEVHETFADSLPGHNTSRTCVLMFSGGRDSTIAALRLRATFERLILVTVTSEHLFGIERVRARLHELKAWLPDNTRWLHVIAPSDLSTAVFSAQTCLPCHRSYTLIAFAAAIRYGAPTIAFGYAGYQSHWPEQTPEAIMRLERIAEANGLKLLLPAYDVRDKNDAIALLRSYNLNSSALEQKCVRQVSNVRLASAKLHQELVLWESAISESLRTRGTENLHILSEIALGDVSESTIQGAS